MFCFWTLFQESLRMLKKQKDPLERLRAQRTGTSTEVEKLRRGGPSKADKLERFSAYLEPKSAEELSATKLKLLLASAVTVRGDEDTVPRDMAAAVSLTGGDEEKIGLKSFEELDEILDHLEMIS